MGILVEFPIQPEVCFGSSKDHKSVDVVCQQLDSRLLAVCKGVENSCQKLKPLFELGFRRLGANTRLRSIPVLIKECTDKILNEVIFTLPKWLLTNQTTFYEPHFELSLCSYSGTYHIVVLYGIYKPNTVRNSYIRDYCRIHRREPGEGRDCRDIEDIDEAVEYAVTSARLFQLADTIF